MSCPRVPCEPCACKASAVLGWGVPRRKARHCSSAYIFEANSSRIRHTQRRAPFAAYDRECAIPSKLKCECYCTSTLGSREHGRFPRYPGFWHAAAIITRWLSRCGERAELRSRNATRVSAECASQCVCIAARGRPD